MTRKRRMVFTLERERRVLLKPGAGLSHAWCGSCGRRVEMVRGAQAALLIGVEARRLERWLAAASVHFRATPRGELCVCLDSLKGVLVGGSHEEE